MATNLIAQMMNEFRGDTLNGVAAALGESPAKTQSALGGVLPALIGGLAGSTTNADQANTLLNVIKTNKLDSGPLTDISGALRTPGGINNLTTMGRPLLDSLFGGRSGGITDWVSSLSGVSRSSSSSLLGLALPLVLGQIGKRVASSGWGVSSLMSLLGEQRQYLQDAPPGLTNLLGDTTRPVATYETEGARHVASYESDTRRTPVVAAYQAPTPPRRSPWLWALPLLLLIPLLLFFMSRREAPRQVAIDPTPTPAPRTEPPRAVPAEPRVIEPGGVAGLGAFVERQLPNNISLRIPANGMESKLLAYIEDTNQVPTKETWFSFDRLEFETDSATLRPAATEQLQNVANIMKAYPDVKVKIGGYTDNTGDSAANLKLSEARATAAMNQIATLGIDRSRLEAEGFGDQHPIADNNTEAGRQRNRRVDIRVTDK
jgi:outer membrane protein OmpA-like peptidoglycan-associated protein